MKRQQLIPEVPEPGAVNPPVEAANEYQAPVAPRSISGEELQRRRHLRHKFNQELASLSGQKVHLIVFPLGNEEYAFDLNKAREVVMTPSISKVPHTPDYIPGVTEIRNSVVLIFDLAKKFGIDNSEQLVRPYTMVIENDQFKVGVLVERVPDTMIVQGDEIKNTSGICADTTQDETYIKGMIKVGERMIFYLDVEELIAGDRANFMPLVAEEV